MNSIGRAAFSALCALCRLSVQGPRQGTLVIQPLPGIGDMVWHLPHIHSIAAISEGGSVSLLTKPRSHADKLFAADPAVKEFIWLERNPGKHDGLLGLFRLVQRLRTGRFTHVWILHGSARYALACLVAGIPRSIGYGRGMQRCLLSEPVVLPPGERRGHPIAMADRLLELWGIPRVESEPQLRASEEARRLLDQRYGHLPRPWIALGIGCSQAIKQWGQENFAELAWRLYLPRRRTLFLLGGKAEREMAHWITESLQARGGQVESIIDLPLDQVVALLSQCHLFIGNDTGVFNMAAALGVNAIGLFNGSYKPLTYSRFIHSLIPERASPGMCGITVDAVLACLQKIGKGKTPYLRARGAGVL